MSELVTVIIPVYNVEKYLVECVDSVLAQSLRDLRVLLVDDGSTDGSGAICDEYAAREERVCAIHRANGGQSAARNAGLALARGEFVYFMDSDDILLPASIETLVEAAEKESCDFVFFDADIIGGNLMPPDYYHRKGQYAGIKNGRLLFDLLVKNGEYRPCIPMTFIRRKFLSDNCISFIEGALYEDEPYALRLFMLGDNVRHLPCRLYKRRLRENSIITGAASVRNFISLTVVLKDMYEFLIENNIDVSGAVMDNLARIAVSCIGKYRLLSGSDRKKCRGEYNAFAALAKRLDGFGSPAVRLKLSSAGYFLYRAAERLGICERVRAAAPRTDSKP